MVRYTLVANTEGKAPHVTAEYIIDGVLDYLREHIQVVQPFSFDTRMLRRIPIYFIYRLGVWHSIPYSADTYFRRESDRFQFETTDERMAEFIANVLGRIEALFSVRLLTDTTTTLEEKL